MMMSGELIKMDGEDRYIIIIYIVKAIVNIVVGPCGGINIVSSSSSSWNSLLNGGIMMMGWECGCCRSCCKTSNSTCSLEY